MRIIGLAGWSGAGKTSLMLRLLPEFSRRGLRVSTIKHAHHGFEIDVPGKDSFEHRRAGAFEVLVASSARYALMRDLRGEPEPTLDDYLARLAPVDLVLVEGFRREPIPKIEIFRRANAKPFLHTDDRSIVALVSDLANDLASDLVVPPPALPHAALDDTAAVADLVLRFAGDATARL
jgi:molybdopterin-guanine dinucleotide biosynthesis protein B